MARSLAVLSALAFIAAACGGRAALDSASPQLVARGNFHRVVRPTEGKATLVTRPDGRQELVLRDFRTATLPQLVVFLVPTGARGNGVRLGETRATAREQRFLVPKGHDFGDRPRVVVWCGHCETVLGVAELAPSR